MIKKLAIAIHEELYETYPGMGDKMRSLRQQLKLELVKQAVDEGKIKPHEEWILKSYLSNLGKSRSKNGLA